MIAPPARAVSAPRTPPPGGASAPRLEADPLCGGAELDGSAAALAARAPAPGDEAVEQQREEFDLITQVQAETERETNALRDMAMEQMKHDDELLKKWIELI